MPEDNQKQVTAINGAQLIDGTGTTPVDNASVVIEGSRIIAAGKDIAVPPGARVIDATGMTIMPGLIDAHLHLAGRRAGGSVADIIMRPVELSLIRSIYEAKEMLHAGFTTVKDCWGMNAVYLKRSVAEGTLTGLPRIVASGYPLSQTFGHGDRHYLPIEYVDARTSKYQGKVLLCDGVDECIRAVRYALRQGSDFIKCFTTGGMASEKDKPSDIQFNLDEIRAIVDTTAQVGKFVTAHCESSLSAMKQSIVGGIKTIDHAFVTDDECIELALKNGAIFVSTLSIIRFYLQVVESPEKASGEMAQLNLNNMKHDMDSMVNSYKRIHQAGAVLAVGTDTIGISPQNFGTNAMELELLVKYCDFTPMDAIVATTKYGAMACFMGDDTGTLEVGKLADIIVIDGDPLADIKVLQDLDRIKLVMVEGRVEKNKVV